MERDRDLPPLKALLAFEAGARLGSFTKAADELHVTQTAISHQIRLLENYYDQKLFDRRSRKITLNEKGKHLLGVSMDLFDQLDRVNRELREPQADQTAPLRITLPPALGSHWLAPRLGEFWAKNAIDLHLIPSTELLDFQLDHIDAGIRCGHGKWPGLEAEFLMPITVVPVCAPELLEQRPGLRTPADLSRYTLLHEIGYSGWQEWFSAHGIDSVDHTRGVICQDSAMLYDLAMRAQGVALGSIVILKRELESGRLVNLFGMAELSSGAYYLIYRKARMRSSRLRAFHDFVLEQAAQ